MSFLQGYQGNTNLLQPVYKYCIQVTTNFKVTKTMNPESRVILIIKSSGGVVALNALADASM